MPEHSDSRSCLSVLLVIHFAVGLSVGYPVGYSLAWMSWEGLGGRFNVSFLLGS